MLDYFETPCLRSFALSSPTDSTLHTVDLRDTDGLLTDVFIDILLLNLAVSPLLSVVLDAVFFVVIALIGASFFIRRVEAAGGSRTEKSCFFGRSVRRFIIF